MVQNGVHIVGQAPLKLIDSLAQLHNGAFKQLGQKGWGADQIGRSLEQAATELAYIVTEDRIAGFALFHIVLDEAELFTIAVDPDYQRTGLASQLLYAVRGRLKQDGVLSLFLEVRSDNVGAISCYEKLGFESIAARKNYYTNDDGAKFDANILRLAL
jgi:ribosomal-protein-alanine acetyltransferase